MLEDPKIQVLEDSQHLLKDELEILLLGINLKIPVFFHFSHLHANPKLLGQPLFILTTNIQTLLICTLKRKNKNTITGNFSITKEFPF